MGFQSFSLSIGRTLSSVGLTTFALQAVAQPANQNTAPPATSVNPSAWNIHAPNGAGSSAVAVCVAGEPVNACKPHKAMRALTPEEVVLVMGANYSTGTQSNPTSHGSCGPNGCYVTASPPPSSNPGGGSSFPPSDPPSPPPGDGGSGGGAGDDGEGHYFPDSARQSHLQNCAKDYGTTLPNPAYGSINYTHDYAWSSKSLSTGVTLQHVVLSTDTPPTQVPAGGGAWLIADATTFFASSPPHTDVYMYTYTSDADIVRAISHEWYHQTHDVAGESTATEAANEVAAANAGANARAAFVADNGAKCAGQ